MGIRYATYDDLPATSRIKIDGWQTAYRGILPTALLAALDYPALLARAQAHFGQGGFHLCVYEDTAGEILGYCKFGPRQNPSEGLPAYDCELHAIYVTPARKGEGIGTALFRFAVQELRVQGKQNMLLWVLAQNSPSIDFYKKMGGVPIGEKTVLFASSPCRELCFGFTLQEVANP